MIMSDVLLTELLALARQAALAAAELIRERRNDFGTVHTKDGASSIASSVVTDVDRAAQAVILDIIQPTCASHGIGLLAEEDNDDGSRLTRDAFWCIDPLDGTLAFVEGRPGFAVSIALVARDGTPLIGVCVNPVTGHLYEAVRGRGALRDGQPFEQAVATDRLCFSPIAAFSIILALTMPWPDWSRSPHHLDCMVSTLIPVVVV